MSDRPAPKFQVGEEVLYATNITRSYRSFMGFSWSRARYAHQTGEGMVTAVGTFSEWPGHLLYKLDTSPHWYTEQSLRKKYRPSTQSFTELLQSIQQPNKVKA